MTPAKPVRVENERGRVTHGEYATGSKSEQRAVFLETARGRLVLRHKTGPAFGDTSLERLVGTQVECDGFLVGDTLLAERITPVS